ncbi:MAG: hypothetical protein H6828_08825 [Planctomycetes bacterium]|nr:hypothetical protein [Planctomycetota bacterium]
MWARLDIHLENLIPGLATLGVLAFVWKVEIPGGDSAFGAVLLVGIAYLVGVLANVLARLLIDPVSKKYTRVPLLKRLTKEKLGELDTRDRDRVNAYFSHVLDEALAFKDERLRAEIEKRRQTGRLCRSAFFPTIAAVAKLGAWGVIAVPVSTVGLLFLYSSAEVALFNETHRAYRMKRMAGESVGPRSGRKDGPDGMAEDGA